MTRTKILGKEKPFRKIRITARRFARVGFSEGDYWWAWAGGRRLVVRPAVEQFVARQAPELSGARTRFLIRRGSINPDSEPAFPILARRWNELAAWAAAYESCRSEAAEAVRRRSRPPA